MSYQDGDYTDPEQAFLLESLKDRAQSDPEAEAYLQALLGFTPGFGDMLSAKDAYTAAKQGNYGESVLNAVGLLPFVPSLGGMFKAAKTKPQKTIKAYKLFRTDDKGNLYPLFVDAKTPVPLNEWIPAKAGDLTKEGKVKSSLGPLAYRPGWHAGDLPIATHIGGMYDPTSLQKVKHTKGSKPNVREDNQVWAEVEMPADVDWQSVALSRAEKTKSGKINARTAHITDQVPYGGHYRYKTNPNMQGNWIISGDMKVNRILSDDEVKSINSAAGVADLPRLSDLVKQQETKDNTSLFLTGLENPLLK